MNSLLDAIMLIGPTALLAALISVPLYYLSYRYAAEPKQQPSVVRYLLTAVGVGTMAYVVGAIAGIAAACAPVNAGNLCGLAGVFGVGPLFSAVAIFIYARSWAQQARRTR